MLSFNPPTQISGFRGPPDTLAKMVSVVQGDRGERSIFVRSMTEEVIGDIWPKDYCGEILAVNNWVSEKVVYVNDPLHVELVKDPQRLCEEIKARGKARGDCFPEGTLLWSEKRCFVKIEDVKVGDKIWGLDKWSTVEGKLDKGLLQVSHIHLSNEDIIPLTSGHKVYVLQCKKHDNCDCGPEDREEIRMRVSELQKGMVLTSPEEVSDVTRDKQLIRVEKVALGDTGPCWDIQTDDHRVYLPEHDVTVSNCDDIATLISTMGLQLGRKARLIVAGFAERGQYSHVFSQLEEPRTKMWLTCDPVAGTGVGAMLSRITTYQIWSCDELPSHGPVKVK